MSEKAIIERIIADAQKQSEDIIADAKIKAKSTTTKASQIVEENLTKAKEKCNLDSQETLRRRMSVANLDAKKHRLFVKQQLINETFELARKKIINLSDADYLKLIGNIINKYAVSGETVTISANDKKRITQEFLDNAKLDLKLSKEYGNFDGGVVLSKSGYDKNLTLDVLIKESRENVEDKVALVMFEEK